MKGDTQLDLERIQKAPLSILQAATAISKNGQWKPTPEFKQACKSQISLLDQLEIEEVRQEIEHTLVGRDVEVALTWLLDIGVLAKFLPEVSATVALTQEAGRRHKDVWEHTILVVKQAVPRPAVRWAALLHDIGKVPTRTFTDKGVHFHGHAEVGARMFDKICRRIPFENGMRRKIRFLIKHHLRSNQYSADWSDSAVRRFSREMDEHLRDLLDLSRADITSKRPGRRQALLKQISSLSKRVEALREKDAELPPLHKGIGNTIMKEFNLPPSKFIGDLKKTLEKAIAQGELEPRQEDRYYLNWLVAQGLLTNSGQN